MFEHVSAAQNKYEPLALELFSKVSDPSRLFFHIWKEDLLKLNTPLSLLNTVLFMNGRYFALRIGAEHRQLRRDPCQIDSELFKRSGERSYPKYTEDLVKAMKDHLQPKPIVIARRFKFHRRNQNDAETVTQYLAELRRLTKHCKFKADYLEEVA